jgi:hypothetical protein
MWCRISSFLTIPHSSVITTQNIQSLSWRYNRVPLYFIDIRYEHQVTGGRPLGPGNFELLTDILTELLKLKFLTSSPAYWFPIWRKRALLCELIIYRLLAVGCGSSCDRATACLPGSTAGCVPCSVEGVTSNGKWGQGVAARPPACLFHYQQPSTTQAMRHTRPVQRTHSHLTLVLHEHVIKSSGADDHRDSIRFLSSIYMIQKEHRSFSGTLFDSRTCTVKTRVFWRCSH